MKPIRIILWILLLAAAGMAGYAYGQGKDWVAILFEVLSVAFLVLILITGKQE